MKKIISILCIVTILAGVLGALVACDKEDGKFKPEISFPSEWPTNEFTEMLPKLEAGKISSATNFRGADRYYLSIKDISIEESIAYVESLIEMGYKGEREEDENFIDYTMRHYEKKCQVSFTIPKGKNSDGEDRRQLGITINTKMEFDK